MGRPVSRAWLKLYEILKIFKFNNKSKTIKTFHICEAPGNMIMSIKYYINKNFPKLK